MDDLPGMSLLKHSFRLQDVTLMYLTALATLVLILVAAYQAPATRALSPLEPWAPGRATVPPLAFHVLLDPRGQLQLAWGLNYSTQEVTFQLSVADVGHGVLLGMSDRGELSGADLVVLWDDGQHRCFGVKNYH